MFIFLNRKLSRIHMDNIIQMRKLTIFHRQLQIMSTYYRLHISKFQLGLSIPSLIALQTACLYNSICFISGKDTGGPIWYNLLYAYLAVVIFFVNIFILGILANVYYVSKRAQEQIKRNSGLSRNKWFKRWLQSCSTFKIYFGGSNFLEPNTPLNIQDFVIHQTVSLMLLQN